MSFRHIAGAFLSYLNKKSETTIESLAFLPIPQLNQAAPEDPVTYVMMTGEVGLPNAV